MSWLYTIVVAGMLFSPDPGAVQMPAGVPSEEIAVASSDAPDESERFEQTYPLNANGRVNVENVNGSITIEAWDRNEVKLAYVKTADTKERLADVEIKIDSRADFFSVVADHQWSKDKDHWRFGNKLSVEIKIMAPRGAVLNEIETVNGSVLVSNFTNVTHVSAVNGSVTARNIRGTANLSTVNGEVIADFDRLESGSKVSLDTVNGTARIILPSDVNATVKADSLNGSITNDFGLPVRKGKYVGRDLYGRLGTGDVQIKLDSVNGGLNITRKNDGKALSPATNLLPQKAKSDEEWEDEIDKASDVDSAKINKQIDKALKDSQKSVAKAVKDAVAQVNRMAPEIAKITAESVARSAEAVKNAVEVISSERIQEQIKRQQERQDRIAAGIANAVFDQGLPRVDERSNSIDVTGVPLVTIDAKGCSVRIRGWDKPQVHYQVTQFTDPRSKKAIALTETYTRSEVTLKVENPSYEARSGIFGDDARSVRIEVFVPRKSNLKVISNGEIRVEGVSGELDLTGHNESVDVRDAGGKLKVATSEGRVRLIGFRGELDSQTECGDLFLEGDFARISAKTTDGMITVTVLENPNFDVQANIDAVTIDNLKVPKQVTEGQWRFGNGGPKYNFTVPEGHLVLRSADSIKATN